MATYQHISHGFDPVFDERSRVLVLGSFPSVLSRKNDFYYGNPNNRFWRVMAHVLGEPVPPNEDDVRAARAAGAKGVAGAADDPTGAAGTAGAAAEGAPSALEESIAAKKGLLLRGRVALWDVIEECDIKGSSDASIKNVVPAHVERIAETARIAAVVCNGNTAGRLYKRYLQWKVGIEAHVLPSTSPANASWELERLAQRWSEEFELVWREVAAAEERWAEERAEVGGGNRSGEREGVAAEGAPDDGNTGERGSVSYGIVKVPAPQASSYAVHKSMQGNKRKDTKPELVVRERLRAAGLGGYRLQWKAPGRPDIAWPGKKVCIFVNGCFWHRCPHCNPSTPKKNVAYWTAKFERNMERDRGNVEALQADGWRVHTIWECELKKKTLDNTMARLLPELASELGKPLRENGDEAAETGNGVAGLEAAIGAAPEPAKQAASTPSPQRHFMYVIECADGTLYTGYTTDVKARFARHCAGTGAKYTRGRGPLNLLAYAEFETKHDAMSAEYRFKKLARDQKDALLAHAAASDKPFEAILQEELLS